VVQIALNLTIGYFYSTRVSKTLSSQQANDTILVYSLPHGNVLPSSHIFNTSLQAISCKSLRILFLRDFLIKNFLAGYNLIKGKGKNL